MAFTLFGLFNVKTCLHCRRAKSNIKTTPGFKLLHCSVRVDLIFELEGARAGDGNLARGFGGTFWEFCDN